MRILQLALRIPYPLRDGGAIAIYNNTKHLSAAGHEVTLLALNTQKHHQDPSVMAEHAHVITTDVDTTPRALPALKNVLFGRLPYNVERFDVPEHHERLAGLLQNEQFDVILLERVYLGVYLETIRKHSDAPVILRAHNVEYEIWQRLASNESNIAKRLFYKQLAIRGEAFERTLLPMFDGLVAITPRDEQLLRALGYNGPSVAIPAGYDLPAELPEAPTQGEVAFLGSLDWLPNQQGLRWLLKQVWPLVHASVPEAKLRVAGRNMPDDIRRIEQAGVEIVGEVESAMDFLLSHPVCVVPLLSGSGMRIKILEAMGTGRAIVTTKIGVEGIEAEDEQHVLIRDTPQRFAEALIELLHDRTRCWELGTAARHRIAERYAWPAIAERFTHFFEQVASQ